MNRVFIVFLIILLNTGMYIVWVEVFAGGGNVEQFKEVVVLSR